MCILYSLQCTSMYCTYVYTPVSRQTCFHVFVFFLPFFFFLFFFFFFCYLFCFLLCFGASYKYIHCIVTKNYLRKGGNYRRLNYSINICVSTVY